MTNTAGAGDVDEAFVNCSPTQQIIQALVDGAAQESLMLNIGGEAFELSL